MSVLDELEREGDFTENEVALARYIRANADAVCTMSISELAKASYSSNAAIVRLCRKVGVSGFRDLRVALAADLERRRTQRSDVDVDAPFDAGASVHDVVSSMAALTKEAIDTCYASVKPYDVERVARAIAAGGHVFLFAHGDSEVSAISFANRLIKLGVHATIANLYGETSAVAHSVKAGDVVIIVSYRGGTARELEGLIPLFKERRCKTVLVSSAKKPLGIDLALRFPAREASHGTVATFYSQTCINFLLNCIYAELFALDFERSSQLKERAEGTSFTRQSASS